MKKQTHITLSILKLQEFTNSHCICILKLQEFVLDTGENFGNNLNSLLFKSHPQKQCLLQANYHLHHNDIKEPLQLGYPSCYSFASSAAKYSCHKDKQHFTALYNKGGIKLNPNRNDKNKSEII